MLAGGELVDALDGAVAYDEHGGVEDAPQRHRVVGFDQYPQVGERVADLAFFFFSSRRRHTGSLCDWSSDVCSSDLIVLFKRSGWTPVQYRAWSDRVLDD